MSRKTTLIVSAAGILVVAAGILFANSTGKTEVGAGKSTGANAVENKHTQKQNAAPVVGFHAPDFTLTDFEGKKATLSELKGKPVFVNFWASWCPPCKAEMPDLVKMAKKYEGKVSFYGVNLTVNDEPENAKSFLQSFGVPYPNLMDTDGTVAKLYQVQGIPTSFLIDANGKIVYTAPGAMNEQQLDSLLQRVTASNN
ncbi:TlpA family protein disulfide reductase [Effusibacillus dendaii]|uniref:Thioredoxin n=1 Tax=Effusibacillus dendaii TaxID=2743772 RepID=A0A7I8DDW4_9BACL|nr:TlpA disulfide reductase family protein [Effusibacillus dendaii]BCJ88295.1 thioredoxin [Effusibacillus dendaii]